ncbi:Bbp1p Ecym_2127 [Eremothecium cymbalariae DBVPG|uniref:Spindle pole component BBP1 n=1 Tax=Eremothecium cymbalariae (strain CBS 270.75 / DBVPG 7215 / KCTC 17166 / NRRL Y-17582) TaxID=931890 RepID=G8JNG4_ERECY|nr:Hypothetical protein Ecym_2127 [Eremothecium cymbalariae DBVPG\
MPWGESSEDSTNAVRWVMDALLGKRESPSSKYRREFSQDDTNNNIKTSKPPVWGDDGQLKTRKRSNSMDTEFRSKYDLLPDLTEQELARPSLLLDPVDIHPRSPRVDAATDTFSIKRHGGNGEVKFRSPNVDDPVISRLFGNKETNKTPGDTLRFNPLPGKYPTPSLRPTPNNNNINSSSSSLPPSRQNVRTIDRSNDYIKLLDQLSVNNKELSNIQQHLHNNKAREHHDASYRQKYLDIRQELIQELKQSKLIYDNYSQLYEKYTHLKRSSHGSAFYESTISNLEAQLVELTIAAQEKDRRHQEELLQLQFRYESRIQDLETLLNQKNNSSLINTTATTTNSFTSDSISPYHKYNDTIDTQFLNHIVK